MQAAKATYAAYVTERDQSKALLSERDQLLAKLLELQKAAAPAGGEAFYPDANSCLRLSAGHVEGYPRQHPDPRQKHRYGTRG